MAQLDLLGAAYGTEEQAVSPAVEMPIPPVVSKEKSPEALRTISEVAAELGEETHVLRFWETKFDGLQPVKMKGNRRYYRPSDIVLLRTIRTLLHERGYTIKGAQALLAAHANPLEALNAPVMEDAGQGSVAIAATPEMDEALQTSLHEALSELKAMRGLLQNL
jgi:DNA-binding transcriptional MerR regulator